MVRLLVADAHCIVRMGLKQLCGEMGGFSVAGEAANGEEMLAALNAADFDMLVLDPGLPGKRQANGGDMAGANLIKTIRARHARLPILAFAVHNDPHTIKKLFERGVTGFLSKSSDHETLVNAMRQVAGGTNFVSHEIAIKMLLEGTAGQETPLTQRESQVLSLLGKGWTLSAIADELLISSRTVSTYKTRMMLKMKFKSNAELFHFAHEWNKAAAGIEARQRSFGQIATGLQAHRDAADTGPLEDA